MTAAWPIRVLLVERSASVRQALRWVLEEWPTVQVVAELGSGAVAVRRAPQLRADLVLLDVSLPLVRGRTIAQHLKRLTPTAIIVGLTTTLPDESSQPARPPGVDHLISKGAGWPAMLAILEQVLGGPPDRV